MFKAAYSKRFDKEFKKYWKNNKKATDKIKDLIADTLEHPTYGIGHPEPLRHQKGGSWGSRHIDEKNRLIYEIIGNVVWFTQCWGHYKDH
jgi:toxin YoeB